MAQNLILNQYVKQYALGGKAYLVVENKATSAQRKFLIKAIYRKDSDPKELVKYKVFEPVSPSKFLGEIEKDSLMFYPHDTNYPVTRNFSWIWNLIIEDKIPDSVNFYHTGYCSICYRPLTDAISLDRGIGPICYNRLLLISNK